MFGSVPPMFSNSNQSCELHCVEDAVHPSNHIIPELKPHYAFNSNLNYIIYQVMVYGDAYTQSYIKTAVIHTYFIRIAITIIVTSLLLICLEMVFISDTYRMSNFYLLSFVPCLYILVSLLWFRHYYLSTQSLSAYIERNPACYARFSSSSPVPVSSVPVRYTLPPPNYNHISLEYPSSPPPAYPTLPSPPSPLTHSSPTFPSSTSSPPPRNPIP